MKLITLDFKKSLCRNLEEQITFAVMMALKSKESMVVWDYPKDKVSLGLIYSGSFVRFSVGNIIASPKTKAISIMELYFGTPGRSFTKESSIDPGQYIYYMEWDKKAFDEIQELIS